MGAHVSCKTCLSTEQEALEAVGLRVLAGEITWNAAKTELGLSDYRVLKGHMENHYLAEAQREQNAELALVEDELQANIDVAVQELFHSMRMAPPEVKPLYAAAIRNLRGLADTKPSQQHLISALKAIQEMTGMKQEQRMMLAFGEKMFEQLTPPVKVSSLSQSVLELTAVESPSLTEASYASSSE